MDNIRELIKNRHAKRQLGKLGYSKVLATITSKFTKFYNETEDKELKEQLKDTLEYMRNLKNTIFVSKFVQYLGVALAGVTLAKSSLYHIMQTISFVSIGTLMTTISSFFRYRATQEYQDEREELTEYIKNKASEGNTTKQDEGYYTIEDIQIDEELLRVCSGKVCDSFIKEM